MFGVVKLLSSIIGNVGESVIEYKENERKRKKYTDPTTNTYTDYRGKTRDASSNQIRYVERQYGGGIIIKDEKFKVIRDLEQEEIDRINAQILREGGVVTVKRIIGNGDADVDCKGDKCIDLKTGRTYVVRDIQNINNRLHGYQWNKELSNIFKFDIEFYMDAQTGLLVRPSDRWMNRNIVCQRTGRYYLTDEQCETIKNMVNSIQSNSPRSVKFMNAVGVGYIPKKNTTLEDIEKNII